MVDASGFSDYSRDESEVGIFSPQVVCFAHSAIDVQNVLRICSQFQVPVTPCGARTGKSGGSLPIKQGVVLSTEKMNRLKEISASEMVAVVEPGIITGDFMKLVEQYGLFYPPDPSSLETCTLGGNVAENAGGARALKYGVTRDYVLGLEVVIPTGEILRVGHRTIKGVAGYDLTSLLVGSEGTLGVITEIIIQLIPLPRAVITGLLAFSTLDGAAHAVNSILKAGVLPRTLELFDHTVLQVAQSEGLRVSQETTAALLVEVDGNDQESLLIEMEHLVDACQAHGLIDSQVAMNEAQRRQLWHYRRQISPALRRIKPYKIGEDIVVPRDRIATMIERVHELGKRYGLITATFGHAGDGNLHSNFLYDKGQQELAQSAVKEMMTICLDMGGSITGEHGIGIAKREFLPLEQKTELIEIQKKIKTLFDPLGILNPGKIF